MILDIATLTGHMVVALGEKVAAIMGTDEIRDALCAAAGAAGESVWPMPIPDEMNERVKSSKVADIDQHDWIRWGGGLYAAAFLREFVDGIPWGHLDIAGPGFNPRRGARLHAERWHRLRDRARWWSTSSRWPDRRAFERRRRTRGRVALRLELALTS